MALQAARNALATAAEHSRALDTAAAACAAQLGRAGGANARMARGR